MTQKFQPAAMAMALAAAFPASGTAAELEPVVVTAPAMLEPLTTRFDPKAPQQPLPANDGASFLKAMPGMNVVRKGGTDGDPVFRGMAGSRLNILLDGEMILGGCGGRMDPPTAYVFPETYDKVTLLKGPQTVLYGPGNSAGTVLFEKKGTYFAQPGWKFNGSLMGGSFGRHDEVADLQVGNPTVYFRGAATHSHSDDYKDGNGNKVHSRYERWSANAAFGLTPDKDTRLEFSAIRSDAKAAYADRMMDGSKFERENYGLKFEKKNISPLVEKLEAQAYYNYIDHVMDSYSLRRGNPAAAGAVSNPDRVTQGGRVAVTLRIAEPTQLKLGLDGQANQHTARSGAAPGHASAYTAKPRMDDGRFRQIGLFGEVSHFLGAADRVIAGLRLDDWKATDQRATAGLATAGKTRNETLKSGFGRYEHDLDGASTLFAGLGHAERFPDYWELISQGKQSETTNSAFNTRPEKTTQLDAGAIYRSGPLTATLSGFYNRIEDFILIESGITKGAASNLTLTRNVDAATWGGEAGLSYALLRQWRADASLAWVRGRNTTDDRPLGQIPPLEGRLGLTWDNGVWTVGSLLRLVAGQDRAAGREGTAIGQGAQGTIVGQDIGRTAGFGVFSLNAGYRPKKGVLLAVGIDNLFDKTYAEHISRAGYSAMGGIAGYPVTTRVNEPGRTGWLKLSVAFD